LGLIWGQFGACVGPDLGLICSVLESVWNLFGMNLVLCWHNFWERFCHAQYCRNVRISNPVRAPWEIIAMALQAGHGTHTQTQAQTQVGTLGVQHKYECATPCNTTNTQPNDQQMGSLPLALLTTPDIAHCPEDSALCTGGSNEHSASTKVTTRTNVSH
jgi:hypothetical protein